MKRFRRFSLLSLLIAITVCAVWISVSSNRAGKLHRAIEQLSDTGCQIGYDFEFDGTVRVKNPRPQGPEFLRKWLGDEYFVDVVLVKFPYSATRNQDLNHLKDLPNVRVLDLDCATVDDIAVVAHLSKLRYLDLENTKITNEALEHLRNLNRLETLVLSDTEVGDKGIEHLSRLENLVELRLDRTNITDSCIEHLVGLKSLAILHVSSTNITSKGVEKIKSALPSCSVFGDDDGY